MCGENGRYSENSPKRAVIHQRLALITTMGSCLSFEVPARFVVVEFDALGTAEVGEDLHDVVLLLGRELVFAVMDTIVRTHACAKI